MSRTKKIEAPALVTPHGRLTNGDSIELRIGTWREHLSMDYAFIFDVDENSISIESAMQAMSSEQIGFSVIPLTLEIINTGLGGSVISDSGNCDGVRTFIGQPIYTNGKLTSVLGFASFSARKTPFTKTEISYIEMAANWSASVLEIEEMSESISVDHERAMVMLEAVGDALIAVSPLGLIEYVNHSAESLTGWTAEEARGTKLEDAFQFSGSNSMSISDIIMRASTTGRSVGMTERNVLTSLRGNETLIDGRVIPTKNKKGEQTGVIIAFKDLSDTLALEDRLSWQVLHDSLTGALNRAEFERRVHAMLQRSSKRSRNSTMMIVGIDQFKVINEICGNGGGDALLRVVCELIRSKVRTDDIVARVGGDEFAVLLEGCSIESSMRIANTIRSSVDGLFQWGGGGVAVTLSIGVLAITSLDSTCEDVMSQAGGALAMAKEKGRNRIWVHQSNDADVAKRTHEMQWVAQIASAIERNRLVLYHQKISPILDKDGHMHVEMLLRMKDENDRLVPPMAFIPAAERYGLMYSLDRWVLREAMRLSKGFEKNTVVAINLSSQSLCADDLYEYVVAMLKKTGADPKRLCLEITETAVIANMDRAKDFMSRIREHGVRFSLDDFGAGWNSFSHLKNLQIDYLKIDGAFVRNLPRDRIDYAMVSAIASIARVMGIKTVAEFVEDQQTVDILRLIGVDYGQGYHIHKPEPVIFGS